MNSVRNAIYLAAVLSATAYAQAPTAPKPILLNSQDAKIAAKLLQEQAELAGRMSSFRAHITTVYLKTVTTSEGGRVVNSVDTPGWEAGFDLSPDGKEITPAQPIAVLK